MFRGMESRFNAFLDENGLTQTEIAGALEVIPSTINKKASGDRPWKGHEINQVLAYVSGKLGRSVSYEEAFGVPAPTPEPTTVQE